MESFDPEHAGGIGRQGSTSADAYGHLRRLIARPACSRSARATRFADYYQVGAVNIAVVAEAAVIFAKMIGAILGEKRCTIHNER